MKKKPIHPGIILRKMYLTPLNKSQKMFADEIQESKWVISRLCNSKIGISARMAIKLGKALNTTPQLWLNMQNDYDLWEAQQDEHGSM